MAPPPWMVSSVYYRDARSTCAGNMTTSTVDKRVFCFPASKTVSRGACAGRRCPGRGLEATTRAFRDGFWARRRGKSSAVSSPLEAALALTAVWALDRSLLLCSPRS